MTDGSTDAEASRPDEARAQGLQAGIDGSPFVHLDQAALIDEHEPFRRFVCTIEAGGHAVGTGFLVGPDLVLTNLHVLTLPASLLGDDDDWERDLESTQSLLSNALGFVFDRVRLSGGRENRGSTESAAPAPLLLWSSYADSEIDKSDEAEPTGHELDFALLRLNSAVGLAPALDREPRGWIDLPSSEPIGFGRTFSLTIFQHPKGESLQVAAGTVASPAFNRSGTRLRYKVSTATGSSGGLAIAEGERPLALHNYGGAQSRHGGLVNRGVPLWLIATHPAVADLLQRIPRWGTYASWLEPVADVPTAQLRNRCTALDAALSLVPDPKDPRSDWASLVDVLVPLRDAACAEVRARSSRRDEQRRQLRRVAVLLLASLVGGGALALAAALCVGPWSNAGWCESGGAESTSGASKRDTGDEQSNEQSNEQSSEGPHRAITPAPSPDDCVEAMVQAGVDARVDEEGNVEVALGSMESSDDALDINTAADHTLRVAASRCGELALALYLTPRSLPVEVPGGDLWMDEGHQFVRLCALADDGCPPRLPYIGAENRYRLEIRVDSCVAATIDTDLAGLLTPLKLHRLEVEGRARDGTLTNDVRLVLADGQPTCAVWRVDCSSESQGGCFESQHPLRLGSGTSDAGLVVQRVEVNNRNARVQATGSGRWRATALRGNGGGDPVACSSGLAQTLGNVLEDSDNQRSAQLTITVAENGTLTIQRRRPETLATDVAAARAKFDARSAAIRTTIQAYEGALPCRFSHTWLR